MSDYLRDLFINEAKPALNRHSGGGGDSKEEQTKAVTVTANGTTEVTPDSGKTLSKVTVEVDVPAVRYIDGNEVEY